MIFVVHFNIGADILEPVQNLYYAGHEPSIFCAPLLTDVKVCSATVLENQRFLSQPSEILNRLLGVQHRLIGESLWQKKSNLKLK